MPPTQKPSTKKAASQDGDKDDSDDNDNKDDKDMTAQEEREQAFRDMVARRRRH